MSSVYYPEHWLTIRSAVQEWLEDESGITVVIQEQNAPSPAKPFIRWGTLVPPVAEGRLEERNVGPCIVIDDVEDEADYTVEINGVDYTFTSDEDATLAEIKAGLIALINVDHDTVSVSASAFSIIGNLTIDSTTANLSAKIAQQYLGDGVMTLTFEALTDSLDQQAQGLTSQLAQSLETEPVIEALSEAGLALVSIENRRKTTQVTAAKWEDRAGFDVRFRVRTRNVKIIDYLDYDNAETFDAIDLELEA